VRIGLVGGLRLGWPQATDGQAEPHALMKTSGRSMRNFC
jgi:hypothetical protein